jgi:hypothetical protein
MRGVRSPPLSPSLSSAAGFSCGKQTSMAKRPRSFEEVVAALSPTERARIGRIDTFFDPNADRDEAEVSLAEDRDQPSEWRSSPVYLNPRIERSPRSAVERCNHREVEATHRLRRRIVVTRGDCIAIKADEVVVLRVHRRSATPLLAVDVRARPARSMFGSAALVPCCAATCVGPPSVEGAPAAIVTAKVTRQHTPARCRLWRPP